MPDREAQEVYKAERFLYDCRRYQQMTSSAIASLEVLTKNERLAFCKTERTFRIGAEGIL